ncbi:MAG: ABC transporter substrate-binding protein [Puniceicoccales bacterium]|jgi:NitT/TauT family transport system substrate-binding protein|nr:ABC transporter substrate-binding protein [Puniceicoccales bacterium]
MKKQSSPTLCRRVRARFQRHGAMALFALVPALAHAEANAAATPGAPLKKITIAHVGSTCDSTVFIAKSQGFFQEEGLDAELVLGDWNFIKEGLAFGRITATQGLVMNYLKPIEQGLDARFTAGIHRGCLHILAPKNSPIKTGADLKGKRIGVPGLGSSPWVFAARVASDNGCDIRRDVEWRPFPVAELKLALDKREVDAIALSDPIAEILLSSGEVKSIVNQGTDAPYKDEYCCVMVVNGKLSREDPATAAAITRAVLKAAAWIEANPRKTAELAVAAKHIAGSVEINARVLSKLDYAPSVEGGREATRTAATALRRSGVIAKNVDIEKLVARTFTALPGLDDATVRRYTPPKLDKPAGTATGAGAKTSPGELGEAHSCCDATAQTQAPAPDAT